MSFNDKKFMRKWTSCSYSIWSFKFCDNSIFDTPIYRLNYYTCTGGGGFEAVVDVFLLGNGSPGHPKSPPLLPFYVMFC